MLCGRAQFSSTQASFHTKINFQNMHIFQEVLQKVSAASLSICFKLQQIREGKNMKKTISGTKYPISVSFTNLGLLIQESKQKIYL